MRTRMPDPAEVFRAIDLYLSIAYEGAPPPPAVASRLQVLRAVSEQDFFRAVVFEWDQKDNPTRYDLRLGNRFYPHMKLAIEQRPDGQGVLYRVDTHDVHCCPAYGSEEYEAFRDLMAKNQSVALAIEAAWEAAGIPTFRTYAREFVARRHAARGQ